ncbi:hypothetical protein ACFV2X_51175 [Streptomyces sp. NPDC059679]|uniref:hypothetical protein n=1 Tax=Streptomyces sp. NPDC059679 TaxID=3346903 RepID=UPI003681B21C
MHRPQPKCRWIPATNTGGAVDGADLVRVLDRLSWVTAITAVTPGGTGAVTVTVTGPGDQRQLPSARPLEGW